MGGLAHLDDPGDELVAVALVHPVFGGLDHGRDELAHLQAAALRDRGES
jgi:hypothetical protein